MRVFSILTALITLVVLFLLVFQRDFVRSVAGFEPEAPAVSAGEETARLAADEPAGEAAGKAGPSAVSVIVAQSDAREIDSAVVLRGRTEAARAVDLRAETSGKVVSPPTPKGTLVSAGDVLCEIDMGTRAASLAEARARLAEAEANAPSAAARVREAEARVTEAQTNLDNAQSLFDDGYAAETRLISAKAAMESARAGLVGAEAGAASAQAAIEAARRALAEIEQDIANTRIAAPFDGVLESDTAELGSLLQPGGACARVLVLDPIKLVGFVAESSVDRVALGALAGARLSSGREVVGQVTFLSRSADPTTRTFRVEAEVANTDLTIRDGQSAEIAIQSTGRMAHLLPQSALALDDEGTLGVRVAAPVEGADGGGEAGPSPEYVARFVPVTLLRDSPEGVWLAGLPQNALVIVVGQDFVTDGVALEITLQDSGS
ncbi:MAG TPA: efflux RND transporter periplasmic adaptor subunit [Rhodobacterales bacterium]|nr:efflux RND transporter periplasmic adaptor subunit [Rhodobacterales bacterium]